MTTARTAPTRLAAWQRKGYEALRAYALRFPEAHEDFPWGHCAIKVRKRIFVSLGADGGELRMSLKLGDSNFEALLLPFTAPTHYGMGKHGWVTSTFTARSTPPMATLTAWIEESYRAVAPKKLVAQLDEGGLGPVATARGAKTKAKPTKKPGSKKTSKEAAATTTRRKSSSAAASSRKKAAAQKATTRSKATARKTTRRGT